MQNLKDTFGSIKKNQEDTENQISAHKGHISTINEGFDTCRQAILDLCQWLKDSVTHAEIRVTTLVHNELSQQFDEKLDVL